MIAATEKKGLSEEEKESKNRNAAFFGDDTDAFFEWHGNKHALSPNGEKWMESPNASTTHEYWSKKGLENV